MTLGPDWAFETGGLGSLTRRVPTSQVVTAVPERQRRAKPPEPPRDPRIPPVVETLRKALAWRQELDSGAVATQAAIARREGITRARVTQVLMLVRLAPKIQKQLLSLPPACGRPAMSERSLRPIARIEDAQRQISAFAAMAMPTIAGS